MGIEKRIQENKNFLKCIDEHGEELQACSWFSESVHSVGIFFDNIHTIMLNINTYTENDNIKEIIKICGEFGQNLRKVQNIDRLLLILMRNIPDIGKKIGFAESWIEDDELFFEDFRHASKQLFKPCRTEIIYPWIGRDYREFLLFNSS